MDWERKLAAMTALVGRYNISLRMRHPGNWYVDARGREVGGDGFLRGTYGNGATPEAAVEDDWRRLTELPPGRYVSVRREGYFTRHRWNGFMWEDVTEATS